METKEQKKERLYNSYIQNFNAIPNYSCFLSSIQDPKDLKVFTEDSFIKYFYKKMGEQKELIKAFKTEKITVGDIVIDSLRVKGSNIEGQRYGYKKQNETLQPFSDNFVVRKRSGLKNKKLGLMEIQDFEIDSKGAAGVFHFMVSNIQGCHVRKTDSYLKSFTDSATKRKIYQLI